MHRHAFYSTPSPACVLSNSPLRSNTQTQPPITLPPSMQASRPARWCPLCPCRCAPRAVAVPPCATTTTTNLTTTRMRARRTGEGWKGFRGVCHGLRGADACCGMLQGGSGGVKIWKHPEPLRPSRHRPTLLPFRTLTRHERTHSPPFSVSCSIPIEKLDDEYTVGDDEGEEVDEGLLGEGLPDSGGFGRTSPAKPNTQGAREWRL